MQDIIRSGVKTKVLLLSATPVNNTLTDLRNQISIIAGGDVVNDETANSAFRESVGITDLKEALRQAQTHFAAWARALAALGRRSRRPSRTPGTRPQRPKDPASASTTPLTFQRGRVRRPG
jgi:hypothetical protein